MKIIRFMLLALAILLPVAVAQAGPLETPSAVGQVLQVAGTYLPLVARSKQDKWVLIKVTPDPMSGFAAPGGSTISGHYTVVQALGAAVASRSGAYSWPWGMFGASGTVAYVNALSSQWLESGMFAYPSPDQPPHNVTCYLLCSLHEEATGRDRFTNVHSVPEGWEDYVLPAILSLRSHPQVSGSASDPAQTRVLLHDPNPYLALAAVQQLAARRSLTTGDVDTALSSMDQRVSAATLALMRFYSWADLDANAPANVQWLTTRVAKIDSLEQLEAVAVGILAASPRNLAVMTNPTTDLPGLPSAPPSPRLKRSALETQVIPAVRQRLKELDPNGGPAEARWRTIDNICRQFGP